MIRSAGELSDATQSSDLFMGRGIPLGIRSTSPWILSSEILLGWVSTIKILGGSGG